MKKMIFLITAFLSVSAPAENVQLGELKCYLLATEKPVNQTLTDHLGTGNHEFFRKEIRVPYTIPKACQMDPNYCEGGDLITGAHDSYERISDWGRVANVRFIITYADGYGSVEIRTHIAASYEFAKFDADLNGVGVSLQYGASVYSITCHDEGRR